MKAFISFVAVIALVLFAVIGVKANLQLLVGVIIPYLALVIFIAGFFAKVIKWGKSPVPFRIPTTCGQQKTLPWIKQDKLENPVTTGQVVMRMALEVLTFRSLFRNIRAEKVDGQRISYASSKWLWAAGLAFHWSFLIIVIRHTRFFLQNVPLPIKVVETLDSFFQIGAPLLYITDAVILGAVTFLVLRRFLAPQVRYISLAADYFPLFLILGIAISGVSMRYLEFARVNVVGVKEFTQGILLNPFHMFSTDIPDGIGTVFYIHLLLISALFAYFPFSKLMHMGGVFMSPTRNLANNSRIIRHVNPWNYPVKVHTYEEYEEEFRDKMKMAGLPLDKPEEEQPQEAEAEKEQ